MATRSECRSQSCAHYGDYQPQVQSLKLGFIVVVKLYILRLYVPMINMLKRQIPKCWNEPFAKVSRNSFSETPKFIYPLKKIAILNERHNDYVDHFFLLPFPIKIGITDSLNKRNTALHFSVSNILA
jgi:hypothetical protein